MRVIPAWAVLVLPCALAAPVAQAAADGGEVAFSQQGKASWYGQDLAGQKTASGERYDPSDMTAAHRKLPLGTEVTVTNLENGKKAKVEVTDRGPHAKGRVIDVSKAAAKKLAMTKDGTAPVRVTATEAALQEGRTDELGKTPPDTDPKRTAADAP